jgi:hypothetical protein
LTIGGSPKDRLDGRAAGGIGPVVSVCLTLSPRRPPFGYASNALRRPAVLCRFSGVMGLRLDRSG